MESKFEKAGWTAMFLINLPNIFQNLLKIVPKSSSGRGFGCLGRVLRRLGEFSRSGWASWAVLEASWAVLGRKRWPTWLQLGSQNGSNIDRKSIPRCLPMLSSFFDRFLIDLYSQLRLPEPSKSLFFLGKNKVFSKKRFSKLASIFDAILVPTWLNFGAKLASKLRMKSI